jgi:hypothetical protein
VLNQANAGSTMPTKFTLSEQGGAPDIAPVFASQEVVCGTLVPTGPIVPALTPGSRVLQSEGDQYSFIWKTDSAWAGLPAADHPAAGRHRPRRVLPLPLTTVRGSAGRGAPPQET